MPRLPEPGSALGGTQPTAGSAGEVYSRGSEVVLKLLGSVVLHMQNVSVEEPGSQRLGQGWGYGVADDDLNLDVGQLIARLDPLVDELEIIREALDTRSLVGGQTSGNTRVDKTPASHRREATGNGLRRTVPPQTAVHCGVIMFALVTLGA